MITRIEPDVSWRCREHSYRTLFEVVGNSSTGYGAVKILDVKQLGASFQINVEEFELRWDWTFEDNQYALIINEAEEGFYYDFSHRGENGLTPASKRLRCM